MDTRQPNWHPISMLPLITEMLDGTLESANEQLDSLRPVVDKPHVLDSNTVSRIITLYTEQAEDHWVFEEQLNRWKKDAPSASQSNEITRLEGVLAQTKIIREEILKIAQAIEPNTIDKIMEMDDAELALAVLSGKIKPPV